MNPWQAAMASWAARQRTNSPPVGGWTFADAYTNEYRNPCRLGCRDLEDPSLCFYCGTNHKEDED